MPGLQSAVAGHWIEVREAARTLHDITELIAPGQEALTRHASRLRLAVEQGVTEYKRAVLQPVFTRLEELSYRTVNSAGLQELERELGVLIWCTAVQKLIAEGKITVTRETPEEPHTPSFEVREIMAQIQQAVQQDASVKQDPAVKNILLQITKYRNEAARLKSLTKTAPEKQRAAILKNFQASFADIFQSIKKNYAEFAEREALKNAPPSRNPLERYPIAELAKLYPPQLEQFARVRATIAYTRREQQGIRETLLKLSADKPTVFSPIRSELAAYEHTTGSRSQARHLARAFALEIINTIDRELRG